MELINFEICLDFWGGILKMIIKFANDAKEGACDYLKNGTSGDRNKKDIRVKLTDLNCKETIGAVNELLKKTNKFDKYKDNYKHIVLSFQEEDLEYTKMQNIIKDFLKMYMHAYSKDEYVYYAEAHKPKMKINKNGEKRHIHIHLFIHKYSPLLNRRLKFDSHPRRRQELNLIKNYLIKKHNLKYTFTNKIISKSKIDIYTKSFKNKKDLKENVEQYILSNLHNYTNFSDMINSIKSAFNVENIKFSKNAKTPYVSIKFRNFERAIRFKGLLFNRETFEEARDLYLNKKEIEKYDEAYNLSLEEMLNQMQRRQEYFKRDIRSRFVFARARKEDLTKNKEFLLFREIQKNIEAGKNMEDIDIKKINKILFKLKMLNNYLNLNLAFLENMEDLGIFRNQNGIKIIKKGGDININIETKNNSFAILSQGKEEEEEAKISAQIIAQKIKAGELKLTDLVIDASSIYKDAFKKELNRMLKYKGRERGRRKSVDAFSFN